MTDVEIAPVKDVKSTAEKLTDHVGDYVQTYLELTAVKVTQKATSAATIGFTAMIIAFLGMIISIFIGLGLSAWFSEFMTDKEAYFLVAAIYVVIAFIIIGFRKQFIFPFLRDKIVDTIYENKD